MNTKPFLLLSAICLCLTSSCTTGGPTIASLGAGSDAAYLNATRGRSDAQISQQQAIQYSRQRCQVDQEMALEQQKRNNFFQTTASVLDVFNSARSLIH